jgi:hypothetical protein
MMGCLKSDQGQLFYEFHLNDAVPEDHLVRKIDAVSIFPGFVANFRFGRAPLANIRASSSTPIAPFLGACDDQ